jgi:hypothetical protein
MWENVYSSCSLCEPRGTQFLCLSRLPLYSPFSVLIVDLSSLLIYFVFKLCLHLPILGMFPHSVSICLSP